MNPKNDKMYHQLGEFFTEGKCYVFAKALSEVFGYELSAVTAKVDGEFVLVHAYATKDKMAIDFYSKDKDFPHTVFDILGYNNLSIEDTTITNNYSDKKWKSMLKKCEASYTDEDMKVALDWIQKYKEFYTI